MLGSVQQMLRAEDGNPNLRILLSLTSWALRRACTLASSLRRAARYHQIIL